MITCKKCGKTLSSDYNYCPGCGSKISGHPRNRIYLILAIAGGILLVLLSTTYFRADSKQAYNFFKNEKDASHTNGFDRLRPGMTIDAALKNIDSEIDYVVSEDTLSNQHITTYYFYNGSSSAVAVFVDDKLYMYSTGFTDF